MTGMFAVRYPIVLAGHEDNVAVSKFMKIWNVILKNKSLSLYVRKIVFNNIWERSESFFTYDWIV